MTSAGEPFLPEPEPAPAQPVARKRSARKKLLLWVVLIMLFLAIWQFLSPEPSAAKPALPTCEVSVWASTMPLVGAVGLVTLFFFWFMRAYRVSTGFASSQEVGRVALAEGRRLDAVDVFLTTAAAHAKQPAYHASAMSEAATAQLLAGQIDVAIHTLAKVEKTKALLFSSHVRTLAASQLAYANALAGDLATAERWAVEARARNAKNKDGRFQCAAFLCVAEAVLAVRRGHSADGVAVLDKSWHLLREGCTANFMRAVEVIRSFGEAGGGVRSYNVVSERLVRVQPVTPGEFAFLGVKWPEMQAFLAAHDLGPKV